MIRRYLRPWQRVRLRYAAFTLIELLTVIAIILVLAALLLNVAGHAQYKSALARATSEIQQISTGLENYKIDNGTYPRSADTDKLNAQTNFDPTSAPSYTPAGSYLFQELSGIHFPVTNPPSKAYITFLPSQLNIGSAAPVQGTPVWIVDPFGLPYGYSTVQIATAETASASPTPANTPDLSTAGYNPTFDLWSTAGYVTGTSGGKSYPTNITATSTPGYSSLWIKNW